jgi:hypothetical protein
MGYPTKVQLIKRKSSEQWYINFPAALAQALEFGRGEQVEWFIEDKENLLLCRPNSPPRRRLKKKHPSPSSPSSTTSGARPARPSTNSDPRGEPKGSP